MGETPDPGTGQRPNFPLTRWSLMQRAQGGDERDRREALDEMARTYWWPLHCFLSRSRVPEEEARDLVQGFFLSLLEKDLIRGFDPVRGRFRTYLLACLKGYWGDQRDHERAQKRGGGKAPLALDDGPDGRRLEVPGKDLTPEEAYERAWAIAKMEWAVARVRREMEARGEAKAIEVLDAYVRSDDPARPGTAELARRTGLAEKNVRYLFEHIRKQIKRALFEQLIEETGGKTEAEEELAWLFACLARR